MIYALISVVGLAYLYLFQESLKMYFINPKHKLQSIIYIILCTPAFLIYTVGIAVIIIVLAVLGTLIAPSALFKKTHKNIFYLDIYFTFEFFYHWIKSYFEEVKALTELGKMYDEYDFYLVKNMRSIAIYIRILKADPETEGIALKTEKRFINDFKNGVDVYEWVVDNILTVAI